MKQCINSYAVYYGYDNVEELKEYDLVIVEPNGQSKDSIDYLKKNNTIPIAYVSVLETNEDCPEYIYLKDEDFLTINDRRIVNSEFKNYLVNLKSKKYAAMLIHKIGDLLLNKGFNGIFLDTVGDIEFDVIPECIRGSLVEELTKMLQTIKNIFPKCIIIQNNGAGIIKNTAQYVDVLMLENPDNKALKIHDNEVGLTRYIMDLKSKYDIRIFVLFEEENLGSYTALYNKINNLHKENEILFYLGKKNYLKI